MRQFVMCVLVMIHAVAGASAQESAGAVYVKGGVSNTVSWLVGGGGFLSHAISAEFDLSHSGLMFGADLRFGWRRVALLPGLRFYIHEEPDATQWEINYPGWTIRPSLAITAGF